jgi:hypothetical protein
MPLEVGGALRLRLEARISRQLAADSRQHKDGGQKAEEMLSVVRGPLSVAKKEKSRGHFKISECGYQIADFKKAGRKTLGTRQFATGKKAVQRRSWKSFSNSSSTPSSLAQFRR